MKLVKKWLFPVLTCFIVVGAAVLPQQISQARDVRQFGQVHAEELAADALPTYEPPSLLDRLELYASQGYAAHPVLSFVDYGGFDGITEEEEALMQSVQDMLTGADVLPSWIFEEEPFEKEQPTRLLLWDPAASGTFQEPAVFWRLRWERPDKAHSKSVSVNLDVESGLPVYLSVFDTNMSQWLPYEPESLRALAERYFALLGLDVQEFKPEGSDYGMLLYYSIAESGMYFIVRRQPTFLTIEIDPNWRLGADANIGSAAFDS